MTSDAPAPANERLHWAQGLSARIRDQIHRVLVGQDDPVDQVLTVLLAAGHAQQRVDCHLQRRHAGAHHEQGTDRDCIGRLQYKAESPDGTGEESGDHRALLTPALDQKASRH